MAPNLIAPDADIVILSLDRVEDTLAAIASALAQEGVGLHVIVLDQGSQPENFARLRRTLDGWPDVTLFASEENLGVAGGRNRATALGAGRVIVGLDNDAIFATPDTVARAVAALDADPTLAAIGMRILRHADGQDDLSSWGYPRALLARAGQRFDAVTFVGAGHAIRRAAWDRVGGYDDRLFFCWEEFDFCLRAIALGWRVRYHGEIAVRHKVAAERRQLWSGRRWFFFVRNRLYIARKHGASWAGLAPRILGYALRGLRHGLVGPTWQAVLAAARMAPSTPRLAIPPEARAYLHANDTRHRGNPFQRLRRELLAALPGHTPRAPEQPQHARRIEQIAPP